MRLLLPAAQYSFLFAILLFSLIVGDAGVFHDPDTAWHLAAGDWIRSHQYIPVTDPWSYSAQGETWYLISWGFDIFLSLLFEVFGFTGLYLVTLLAVCCTLILMTHYAITRGAWITVASLFACFALLLLFKVVFARPNLVSLLFTVIFYLSLQSHRTTQSVRSLLVLPLLMIVWVNMHGGFLFGFLLVGIFWLDALSRGDIKQRQQLLLCAAACLIASFANPYGYALYYGAWRTLSTDIADMLVEWQPAEIGTHIPLTVFLFLLLGLNGMHDTRIPLTDRLLTGLVFVMTLSSIRHLALLAPLSLPFLALRTTHLLQDHFSGGRWNRIEVSVTRDMHKHDVRWLALAFAGAALFLSLYSPLRDALLMDPLGFPSNRFPKEEAEFVKTNYADKRFYTDYNLGGYLVYLWRGSPKVFVDGRASSLYSENVLKDAMDYTHYSGFGGRTKVIEQLYRFDGVIIGTNNPDLGMWMWNPDWKLVHKGKAAAVLIRNHSKTH